MPMHKEKIQGKYFIGANTSNGFVNYASEIINKLDRVYIIKGGPGTGKSTLMKKVLENAEMKGYSCELYFCSSDDSSLDGIIVKEASLGIIDGTSPHSIEPTYPGAVEEIINLGQFWDKSVLFEKKDEIRELSDEKKKLFSKVYRNLSVCKELRMERKSISKEFFNYNKARAVCERIIKSIGDNNGYLLENRQISAFGMNGFSRLSTYEDLAEDCRLISDSRGVNNILCDVLFDTAKQMGVHTWLSRNCFCEVDAFYFPKSKTAILSNCESEKATRIINTERFINKADVLANKKLLRFLSRTEDALINEAQHTFEEIKKCHFSLENIYSMAMDFNKSGSMYEKIIESF